MDRLGHFEAETLRRLDCLRGGHSAADVSLILRDVGALVAGVQEEQRSALHALRGARALILSVQRTRDGVKASALIYRASERASVAAFWYESATPLASLAGDMERIAYSINGATVGGDAAFFAPGDTAAYAWDEDDDPAAWENWDGDDPHSGMWLQAAHTVLRGLRETIAGDDPGFWDWAAVESAAGRDPFASHEEETTDAPF